MTDAATGTLINDGWIAGPVAGTVCCDKPSCLESCLCDLKFARDGELLPEVRAALAKFKSYECIYCGRLNLRDYAQHKARLAAAEGKQ